MAAAPPLTTNRKSDPTPDVPAPKKRRRPRRWVSAAVLLVLVVAAVAVARSDWFANEVASAVRTQVKRQTGLDLTYDHVGFSWRHLTVRAEGVHLRHPTEGLLAEADSIEIRPSFTSVFGKKIEIASINVDGGEVNLRFRRGQLVNGPAVHAQQGHQDPELPFRDLAANDVHVHVEHDELGTLDLPSVDFDAHNGEGRRLLLGVLAQGGRISNARCYNGPVPHLEARGELVNWRTLTLALAHIEAGGISLRVRQAILPLSMHGVAYADASVSGAIPRLTCMVPLPERAPRVHGNVDLSVAGAFDLDTQHFSATGHLHAQNMSLEMLWAEGTGRFGLGDDSDLRFTANQDLVTVDSLLIHHSGGAIVSPGIQPEHPIRLHIADRAHPTLEGHLDVQGVQLHRLVHELSVTEFAKVLWNVSAQADLHGELWRFGEPADPHHPAIWFDVNADTRDFAILRDFYMRQPQFAVISIPHGTITGTIAIDPVHVRFKHLVGLFGLNNRSRVDVDMVQLRMNHDDNFPDVVLDNAHGEHINLADVGHIADFPISGEASFTAHGGGLFRDPIVTGEAHLRDFHYNGFPLGDYDTRAGNEWRFRQLRVDLPVIDGRAGRSTFVARNSYLDFSQYVLRSYTHVASDNFVLRDYYHMFKFENDPVYEQYSGQTMPRCPAPGSAAARARTANDVPCVDPNDPYEHDPRRVSVPPGTESGHIEADASFVLGRPGDDPNGVMDVELWTRNLFVIGFGEPLANFDTHYRFSWLVRDRGYHGTRQDVEFARARYAGGYVEASGNVDLGGQMHFVGNVRNVALSQTAMAHDSGATGTLNASGSLEGWPEAQRWSLSGDVHSLTMAQRNMGDVSFHVNARPDGPRPLDPNARPPRNLWTLDAGALGSALRVTGNLLVPWRPSSWRDVDGNVHPAYDRDWTHSVATGSLALDRPLDVAPLLPGHMLASLGESAHATLQGRLDLDRALIGDLVHADARLTVQHLDVGANGLGLSLDQNAPFAACIHDGYYWVEPQAATSADPCAHVPGRVLHAASATRAESPLPSAGFLGPQGTHFSVSGGGNTDGRLALRLDGQLDLSRLAPLATGITRARGIGDFQVNILGDMDNPQLSGTFQLDNGAVAADVLPNPVEAIQLRVRLAGNDIVLDRALANFGTSSIDLTGGAVHLQGFAVDRVEIPLRVQNLSLTPAQGVDVALETRNAELSWTPRDRLPRLTGDVTFTRVRYARPINLSQDQNGETQVASGDASADAYDPANSHVQFDLTMHAREPIRVSNNLFDGEIVIAENERPFRVTGDDQRMGVVGTLVIPRGRIIVPLFRGSDFEISRGRIELNNPEQIQPSFDVTAQTDVRRSPDFSRNQQWRVNLHAYGTPDRFALDMTSDPALSREDIVLLLTFGATRAELDQAGAGNLGQAVAVQALATATGIDRTVQQAIPVIDDFRIGSAYSPSSGRTVPQVAIGRHINDRVRVGATVNTSDQREMRATVDIRVTDHTSVQLGYDNINAQGSSQVGNIGADLRWRLEFE